MKRMKNVNWSAKRGGTGKMARYFTTAVCGVLMTATVHGVVSAKSASRWQPLLTVQDTRLNELSGLSESVRYPGYFWANNDSGDSLRCFLVAPSGETVAVVSLQGFKGVDTETIRVAGTPGNSFVYIGDIGDNRRRRAQIEIYRFAEPELDVAQLNQDVSLPGEQMALKYGDGKAENAETILIDNSLRIGIVTKTQPPGCKYWITPRPFSKEPQTLQLAGEVPVYKWRQFLDTETFLITDGVLSEDGKRLALMTRTNLFLWNLPEQTDVARLAQVLVRAPDIDEKLPVLKQAESVSFVAGTSRLAISTEGKNPPVLVADFER